jgi:hypothetical protein
MLYSSDAQAIHNLVQQFAVKSGCDGVVALSTDYKATIASYPDTAIVFLLQMPGSRLSEEEKKNLPQNVAPLSLRQATEEVLKNKVFICTNYLEKTNLLTKLRNRRALSAVAEKSALSIITVAKSQAWDDKKFKRTLRLNKSAFFGQYLEKAFVAIGGRLTDVTRSPYPLLPVLALVSQFNEIDIIEPVVIHLLDQGVDVHVIDNWSDDGSYEAVNQLSHKYKGRVSVERFPKNNTGKYEWTKILTRVTEVAKERPQYKWIISNDADEIRWSPWPGISLQKAISFIDYAGFNVIDYTVFNYSPTKDGYKRGVDPIEFFKYGDFGHEGWHFMQLKTWKNHPAADIASTSGHLIKLPEVKIFPLKFFLGHYSLRSNAQGHKKVFQDRKPRFKADEKKKGWHSHYDKITVSQDFIKDKVELLDLSDSEHFFSDYMLERLTGTGIKINKVNQSKD